MPETIQRPQIVEGLVRLLNLRGRPPFTVREEIGIALSLDVKDSAYFVGDWGRRWAARVGFAAVAAQYSHAWVQSVNAQNLIQIDRVVLVNNTAAALDYFLGWMAAASAAIVGVSTDQRVLDVSSGLGLTLIRDIALRDGSDVANQVSVLDYRTVPAGGQVSIDFANGGIVIDPSRTTDCFTISGVAVNTPLYASIYGRAWPIIT